MFCLYTLPLARPAQAKIQMLTTSSWIVTIFLKSLLKSLGLFKKFMNSKLPNLRSCFLKRAHCSTLLELLSLLLYSFQMTPTLIWGILPCCCIFRENLHSFYTDQYAFSLFPIWARFKQNLDAKGKSIIFGGKAWFGYVPGGIIQSNIPAYNWA